MVVSLAITGFVFVLASNAALGQLRFLRGLGEVVALRSQLGQAAGVAASVLRSLEAPEDVLVALDTAVELNASFGAAFACGTDTGRVLVPVPSAEGNTLAAFGDMPQPGDVARVLLEDDSSATWVGATVAASPAAGGACAAFADVAGTWAVSLAEPIVVPAGAAVRFARRTRLSVYRASDGRWYLGLREWNGALARFNGIQPVAGPLRPSAGAATFTYRDTLGAALAEPVEPGRVATIDVRLHGETTRPARVTGLWSRAAPMYQDSLATVVTLRNAP